MRAKWSLSSRSTIEQVRVTLDLQRCAFAWREAAQIGESWLYKDFVYVVIGACR
jgi:hypothetical protein